ncbi:hypothetical protein, partial [Campylobacter armoricus]|uniref:hypothetical protein n=1 Tax=Campylobacter armoricus TaxID=2505970 RepID=UPI001375DB4B
GHIKTLNINEGSRISGSFGIAIHKGGKLSNLNVNGGVFNTKYSAVIFQGAKTDTNINIANAKITTNDFGLYMLNSTLTGNTFDIKNSTFTTRIDGIAMTSSKVNSSINLDNSKFNAGTNAILLDGNSKLTGSISIKNNSSLFGGTSGIGIRDNSKIASDINIEDESLLGGKIGITLTKNAGIDGSINLKNGATIASLKQEKDALKYDESGTAILNEGTIKGNINLDKESKIIGALHNKNTIGGNISLNDKSYISSINNEKNIQGSIDLKEQSHINSILNNGTIEKGISLDKSTIGSIVNTGIIGN